MGIRTTASGQKMPNPIDKDSRGVSIAISQRVAYNFSGSVAMGYISAIDNIGWVKTGGRPNMWCAWRCKYKIRIENENGHVSTIKNPNSFIVI